MRSSMWIASVLATVALAVPTYSPPVEAADMDALNNYFQLLGSTVQAERSLGSAPVCDLSEAQMPSATGLPPPAAGLTLKHVAIGRGTQNYSCSANNATATPVALGAVATLFNASCLAATFPEVLAEIPGVALQFNLNSANQNTLNPANLAISGHHYFVDSKTPFFDLDTTAMQLGEAPCQKNASVPAPANAPVGQGGQGFGAVPWLRLLTKQGATGELVEVYRINTAGGNPPPNCGSSPATFEVQYAAEYWFWRGP